MGYVKDVPVEEQIVKAIYCGFATANENIRCKNGVIEKGTLLFVEPTYSIQEVGGIWQCVCKAYVADEDDVEVVSFLLPCAEDGRPSVSAAEAWVASHLTITDTEVDMTRNHREFVKKTFEKRDEYYRKLCFWDEENFRPCAAFITVFLSVISSLIVKNIMQESEPIFLFMGLAFIGTFVICALVSRLVCHCMYETYIDKRRWLVDDIAGDIERQLCEASSSCCINGTD